MSARHDNRDRQGPDTTPFHTYRLGSVVPDNSSGRTPIGDMTNDELYRGIYRPAMATMPACQGDCQQMGGKYCPHTAMCQADSKALLRQVGLLCVCIVLGIAAYQLWRAL